MPDPRELFHRLDERFLIMDFDHLFTATTLRDEIWLLTHGRGDAIMEALQNGCARFGLPHAPERELDTFSGGERVMLAVVLICAVLDEFRPEKPEILLVNILETLTPQNRERVLERFAETLVRLGGRLFSGIEPVVVPWVTKGQI
jgi:energy-coupling factor transporter ATP-binding protein EcfA2